MLATGGQPRRAVEARAATRGERSDDTGTHSEVADLGSHLDDLADQLVPHDRTYIQTHFSPEVGMEIGAADSRVGDPDDHVCREDDLRVGRVFVREVLDVLEGDGLQGNPQLIVVSPQATVSRGAVTATRTDHLIAIVLGPFFATAVATLLVVAACATARDPGYEIADAEAAELDCRLIKAGHFFFTVPRYGDTRAVYGRIEALGFDRTENRFTVWGSERNSAGVLVRYIESVEGDGLRYADARCRFRRGNPR